MPIDNDSPRARPALRDGHRGRARGAALVLVALQSSSCGPERTAAAPAVTVSAAAPEPPVTVAYTPRRLALGSHVSLAKTPEGGLLEWGGSRHSKFPEAVAFVGKGPSISELVELAVGTCACGRFTSGEVSCWQFDLDPKHGHTTGGIVAVHADAISGRAGTFCARSSGSVSCWEYDDSKPSNAKSVPEIRDALDLAVGGSVVEGAFGCVIRADGSVTCWGHNDHGQMGAPPPSTEPGSSANPRDTIPPRLVPGISRAVGIAAGAVHACAILAGGNVVCWGARGAGELTGEVGEDSAKPLAVPGVAQAKALALGDHHSCALLESGKVTCWGGHYSGQLGLPRRVFAAAPTEVPGLDGVIEIAAGALHTCARKRAGTLVCWGSDEAGQLGVGERESRRPPVVVGQPLRAAKPVDAACPAGRVHVADWRRWEEQLTDTSGDEDARGKRLEEVALRPFPDDAPREGVDPERACAHAPELVNASVQDAQLADKGPAWKVVEVRFNVCAPELEDPIDEPRADKMMRVVAHQILRPIGDGDFCPVRGGDMTSFTGAPVCTPSGARARDHEPGALSLVDLVSAKHKTLRLDVSAGSCFAFDVSFLSAQSTFLDACAGRSEPELCKLTSIDTSRGVQNGKLHSPIESTELTVGKGPFPRTIVAATEVSCPESDPPQGCKPSRSRSVHVYRDGRYVDPTARPPAAKPKKPAKSR